MIIDLNLAFNDQKLVFDKITVFEEQDGKISLKLYIALNIQI